MSKCEKCGYDAQGTNDTAHFCGKFEKLTMEHHSPRLWTNSSATPPAEQVADSGVAWRDAEVLLHTARGIYETECAARQVSARKSGENIEVTSFYALPAAEKSKYISRAALAAQPAAEPKPLDYEAARTEAYRQGVHDERVRQREDAHAQPAAGQVAIKWPNGCDRTIPNALRYLARNPRPQGGQEEYNAEHLLQLADEMDKARALLAATGSGK